MANISGSLCAWHHIKSTYATVSHQYLQQAQKMGIIIIINFTGEKRGEQRLSNLPEITQDSEW